jgi:NAD(P)-dependent dehydrogenase (short-subunit alcohol dehydrogenase family)
MTTARLFAERGWNVVATMRDVADADDLRERTTVLVARLDLLDSDSIRAALAAALQRFGAVDVLLNNAGYGAYGPLEATAMDVVRRQFDVNVFASFFTMALIGVAAIIRAEAAPEVVHAACRVTMSVLDCEASPHAAGAGDAVCAPRRPRRELTPPDRD